MWLNRAGPMYLSLYLDIISSNYGIDCNELQSMIKVRTIFYNSAVFRFCFSVCKCYLTKNNFIFMFERKK